MKSREVFALTLNLQYVPSVPNDDFVAVVEGPVNFVNEGAYKFCINSDDGLTEYLSDLFYIF